MLIQILGKTENVLLCDSLDAEMSELSGFIKKLVMPHLIRIATAKRLMNFRN